MVFKFKDKQNTIKHLSFVLEVKSINSQTLMVKETYGGGTIMQDLLFYDNEKKMASDINKLFKSLKTYVEHMNNMQSQVGFIPREENEDDMDGEPEE